MRIIAGSRRSLPLKTPPGLDTRPTSDKIKETLFNMIHQELPGCRFLDLFAGSGQIGLEALSRGAESAVFAEKNPKAAKCIEENILFTKFEDQAVLLKQDVITALKMLDGKERFDIVFMDPPYQMGLEREVLAFLSGSSLVDDRSTIIVEASLHTSFDDIGELGYEIAKYKKYKTNAHVFLRRR